MPPLTAIRATLAATLNKYCPMKIIIGLITILTVTNFSDQRLLFNQSIKAIQTDTSSPLVVFFEDFNNNKNNWTIADNKNLRSIIDSGFYYLTAVGHAYGEAQEVKIDTRKDFE